MGYSSERGAAARNLLRARAHGHEDAIADAETLAHGWLGSGYSDDGEDEVEEYIADHYADFTPEPPVITDDMVKRAGEALYENFEAQSPHWNYTNGDFQGATLDGAYDFETALRSALEAALNPKENES